MLVNSHTNSFGKTRSVMTISPRVFCPTQVFTNPTPINRIRLQNTHCTGSDTEVGEEKGEIEDEEEDDDEEAPAPSKRMICRTK